MVKSLQGDGKAIFVFFVGVIITVVFLAAVANSVFTQTTTASATNLTFTVSAINTSLAITGRDLITATSVINATNLTLINEGVIISDGIVAGVKTVTLTANDTASDLVGTEVNATYTYNPDGYIANAGGRSIADLIPIFAALAILVFGFVAFVKSGTLGALLRRK